MNQSTLSLSPHLTFKGNLKQSRYGWLRLTPAYSVQLVSELLSQCTATGGPVLDPFCGTGTTALACGERGIACDTTDINPFLLWLTKTKCRPYTAHDVKSFAKASDAVGAEFRNGRSNGAWVPPIHQLEKWWSKGTIDALARARAKIQELSATCNDRVHDLLKIVFCRVMIENSHVSFGHQSMSFKKREGTSLFPDTNVEGLAESWSRASLTTAQSAQSPVVTQPGVFECDARDLTHALKRGRYSLVITSPPYPNRMSYIRELRPYMYWLQYLSDGREAGELDWLAIGGTWGCATSNVGKWTPPEEREIPFKGFRKIVADVAQRSPILSRYIHKYFFDMVDHVRSLFEVVRGGGQIHYIVGNSKFYDVLLPVESIFKSLFEMAGFVRCTVKTIRKRTSKKELYEYVVSAVKE